MSNRLMVAFATGFIMTAVGAPSPKAAPTPEAAGVVVTADTLATIETVDRQARQVLVRLPDDTLVTLQLSPQVHNLDQLKPGDHVLAKYFEASLVHVKKSPDAPVAEAAVEVAAPPGAEVKAVTTVVGIDPIRKTIALKGSDNKPETMTVPESQMVDMKGLKVGDNVEVTYTKAVAISLDPVPV
jgi:hypothetical protein